MPDNSDTVVIIESVCGFSLCRKQLRQYPDAKKLNCGHVRCRVCLQKFRNLDGSYRCGGCDVTTSKEELAKQKTVLSIGLLDQVEQLKEELKVKAEEYGRKIIEIKEEYEKEHLGNVICRECDKADREADIQVCEECAMDNIEKSRQTPPTDFNIRSIAICAACAIRNHMKKGHNVTDYLPIAIAYRNTVHQRVLKPMRKANVNESIDLKKSMDNMMNVIEEAEKELDRRVAMIKRSKTRAFPQKVATEIEKQVQENYGCVIRLREHIKNEENMLHAMITKLAAEDAFGEKEINAENKKDCDKADN